MNGTIQPEHDVWIMSSLFHIMSHMSHVVTFVTFMKTHVAYVANRKHLKKLGHIC